MKVLVTGGAGFIGSHTCVELQQAGHEVVIVDNLSNSKADVVEKIQAITGVKPVFYKADVCDRAALEEIFTAHKIDAVIHFAGLKAVGESCRIPLAYYRNNLDSTLTLVETMTAHGCTKLVFSSSATVYGPENPVPYVETMPAHLATNPYGWTKIMIEQILRDYAAANPEFTAVLLRYFNPIGAHESGLLGEDPNGIPNNLMPYIARVAAGKLEKLTVFGNDYPTPDGTGRAVSVLELVNTFEQVNGVKVNHVIGARRDGDLAKCWADTTKAKDVLGWTAEKTVEDMCRDSWNFVKSHS